MKARQIREMTPEELGQKYHQLREEHFNLRFQAASGQIEKPHLLRAVRRDIARILTILRERKKAEGGKQTAAAETARRK